MSESLDRLLDKYIALQDERVFLSDVDENEKAQYVDAIKRSISEQVYEDIKEEIKEEVVKEAEEIINEKAKMKQIEELKKLTLTGFIVAMFVGLLVNQITDIIGYYKKSVILESIMPTFVISIVLFLICIAIFAWLFMNELLRIISGKRDQN